MDRTTANTVDLIARLRNPVGLVTENIMRLNNEAADEIERLLALVNDPWKYGTPPGRKTTGNS